jgi:hypothetical protein
MRIGTWNPAGRWSAQDLEGLFHGRTFVAGGDLNSALLFDTNNGYDNNSQLFLNLAQGGFHDLRTGRSVDEQRTYYKAGKGHYQLDHL